MGSCPSWSLESGWERPPRWSRTWWILAAACATGTAGRRGAGWEYSGSPGWSPGGWWLTYVREGVRR